MKLRALPWLVFTVFVLAGCDKPDPDAAPTVAQATVSPTPTATPPDAGDETSDKLRRKADKTIKSLNGFLQNSDPKLQAKLQKLADKIAHDKDGWRRKLEQKRDQLRPQIDLLKEQVARAEGKSKADVDKQISALEAQSHNAQKKLTELEGASGDVWKKIKAQLKDAEAKGDVSRDDDDTTPTPTPTP